MPEPFRTDDELVSAVLDGEATPAERARVAADPVLSARLAEFAAVADAVRAPVAPSAPAARDTAIAAAVAEARRPDPVVVPLRPRRSTGSFLAVAAAILAVLLVAGFFAGRLDRGDDTSAQTADLADRGDDGSEDSGGAESSEEATAEAETDGTAADAFSEAATVELGAVEDEAALRAALVATGALSGLDSATTRSTLPAPTTPADQEAVAGDSEACQVRLEESDPALDGLLLEGTAVYADTDAVVYVFATVDGDTRVVVVSAADCADLVSFPF